MKQFIVMHKVIISALLSALILVFQQFQTAAAINYLAFAYACLLAILGVIANQWKMKGTTILGFVGTAAYVFTTTAAGGNFAWPQFFMSLMGAILLAFTSELNADIKPTAIILLCCAFLSCSPQKTIARQDAANTELKAKWAVNWAKDNPCDNDTIISPTTHDTLITYSVKYDTLYSIKVLANNTSYPQSIVKTVTITEHIRDSIKTNTKDRRDIDALTTALSASQSDVVKQTALTGIESALKSKFQWLFWLTIAAVAIVSAVATYFILTPKHFA